MSKVEEKRKNIKNEMDKTNRNVKKKEEKDEGKVENIVNDEQNIVTMKSNMKNNISETKARDDITRKEKEDIFENKEEKKEGKNSSELNVPNQDVNKDREEQVYKVDNNEVTKKLKGKGDGPEILEQDLDDSVVEEKNKLISVKDIIEALSIVVAASRNLQMAHTLDFVTLENMQVEVPQVVEKLEPELFFFGDSRGEWALMWGKQRIIKTLKPETVAEYPELIKHLHHVTMGTAKELYRIFRIKMKMNQGTRMILDPTYLGFDHSMLELVREDMRKILIDHPALFGYTPMGTYDEHNIAINPALRDLHAYTQGLILDEDASRRLREWMERFAERKRYSVNLGGHTIYGNNNTRWFNHSSPANLPSITSHIPNFNLMSITYSAPFCVPECTLTALDLTQLSQTMQINVNRANPLSELISAPSDAKNYEDYRRIMLAMILPGQVMVDVEMNPHANAYLSGFTALCAKLMFSTTPNARNISMDSARELDIHLMHMLEDLGYQHEFQTPPLQVTSRRIPDAALWQDLSTREGDGRGWINHGVNCFYRINDPLYVGINNLIIYGGKDELVNANRMAEAEDINPTPIIDLILRNLMNASVKQEASFIQRVLRYLSTKYSAFLMNLNQFIVRYGECGFKLSDRARAEMDRLYDIGGLQNSLNTPIRITVQGNSIWKFFLRLPNTFVPNTLVLKQPKCESVVSAEIQRIVSVYLSVLDWVERDGRNNIYVPRRILKLVLESNESNVIAKRIFDYCFHKGDIQRINIDALRAIQRLFDDFESVVIPRVALVAYENLEIFGLTRDVIYRPREIAIPVGNNFEEAKARGWIQDNSSEVHENNRVTLTHLEMERELGNLNFLSIMKQRIRRNQNTVLPIYMIYKEYRGQIWEKETIAWDVSIPDVRIVMSRKEVLTPKTFTHQYMLPPMEGPAFPDLFLINGSLFKFWYIGNNGMTFPASPATIGGNWLALTRSHKDYVTFRSPLDYETT